MSNRKQYIKWFLSEIPELTGQGVLTEESAGTLEKYYRGKLEGSPSGVRIFSLIMGLIGILMISAGIILFLNYNWDMFPKSLRIVLAALPLALGAVLSYITIAGSRGQLWREASAILTSAGAGTLIAVLSQIYHTGGEYHEFIFLLLLLSLPQVYIFNSIGLASICIFLSFGVNSWNSVPWWNALVLFLLLPYLLFHLREKGQWCVWCRYLALVAGLSIATGQGGRFYPVMPLVILCGIFLISGGDLLKKNVPLLQNPWLIPAFAGQCVLLAAGSSTEHIFRISTTGSAEIWVSGVVNALLAVIFLVLLLRQRITAVRGLPLLLIMLTAIPLVWDASAMRNIYNVYFGLAGIILMHRGIKQSSLLFFNGGAVMICILTACRFFDSGIGVLYRSGGLLLLGIGFMIANVLFAKHIGGSEK